MTLLLKQIFAFFKLLNSDTGENSMAVGLALGLVMGFSPFLSLQTILFFIIVFFFRVQMGAAFLAAFFFKFAAYLVDPISDQIGRLILENQALRPLFTQLYNMPIVPLTRFNNSIVMGSGILGFLLAAPGFFVFKALIKSYRAKVVSKFKNTKLWKAWTGTTIYKWYTSYEALYG